MSYGQNSTQTHVYLKGKTVLDKYIWVSALYVNITSIVRMVKCEVDVNE